MSSLSRPPRRGPPTSSHQPKPPAGELEGHVLLQVVDARHEQARVRGERVVHALRDLRRDLEVAGDEEGLALHDVNRLLDGRGLGRGRRCGVGRALVLVGGIGGRRFLFIGSSGRVVGVAAGFSSSCANAGAAISAGSARNETAMRFVFMVFLTGSGSGRLAASCCSRCPGSIGDRRRRRACSRCCTRLRHGPRAPRRSG